MSCLPTVNFVFCIGNAFICVVLHYGSRNANFLQLKFFPGAATRKTGKLLRQLEQQSGVTEAWRKALGCWSPIKIKVLENTSHSRSMSHFDKQLCACLRGKLVVQHCLNNQVRAKQLPGCGSVRVRARYLTWLSAAGVSPETEVCSAGLLPALEQSWTLCC